MSFKTLVSAVTEQCQEIKQALALLPYFESWEPDLIAECCRVSSIAEFPSENIILGPDTGNSHMVYFILEGVCKIIKNLHIEVKTDFRGEKLYKLSSFSKAETLNKNIKNEQYYSRLFNHEQDFQKETECNEVVKSETENEFSADKEKKEKPEIELPQFQEINKEKQNGEGAEVNTESSQGEQKSPLKENIICEPDHHRRILQECRKRCEETIRFCKKVTLPEKPKNAENFFLQIGFLFKGACFGLDKNIEENYMSVTGVKCLKVPQRFLVRHNPCNIWNRIRLFYSLHFPKDEDIFERFCSDRKWIERKKRQTEEIVYLNNLFNYTLINDVPYSIRLTIKR